MFDCVYIVCVFCWKWWERYWMKCCSVFIYNIELVGFSLLFSSVCFGHTLGAVAWKQTSLCKSDLLCINHSQWFLSRKNGVLAQSECMNRVAQGTQLSSFFFYTTKLFCALVLLSVWALKTNHLSCPLHSQNVWTGLHRVLSYPLLLFYTTKLFCALVLLSVWALKTNHLSRPLHWWQKKRQTGKWTAWPYWLPSNTCVPAAWHL